MKIFIRNINILEFTMSAPEFTYQDERFAIPHEKFILTLLINNTLKKIYNEICRLSNEAIGSNTVVTPKFSPTA